jgi:hypothetical protein
MPAVTRRRNPDAPQATWLVYYGDVRVGSIAIRSGDPAPTMMVAPITSAGRFSPLGPLGIIFLLVLCGPVFGFRGKFVEIGLISICLVL